VLFRSDLTPMVDVVFLLIIFFLTTSSLIETTRAEVDLPKEQGEEGARSRPHGVVINITQNGTFIVEQATLSFEELALLLRAELGLNGDGASELDVVIRADRGAPLRHLNRVAEYLSGLGVRSWRLATEVPAS